MGSNKRSKNSKHRTGDTSSQQGSAPRGPAHTSKGTGQETTKQSRHKKSGNKGKSRRRQLKQGDTGAGLGVSSFGVRREADDEKVDPPELSVSDTAHDLETGRGSKNGRSSQKRAGIPQSASGDSVASSSRTRVPLAGAELSRENDRFAKENTSIFFDKFTKATKNIKWDLSKGSFVYVGRKVEIGENVTICGGTQKKPTIILSSIPNNTHVGAGVIVFPHVTFKERSKPGEKEQNGEFTLVDGSVFPEGTLIKELRAPDYCDHTDEMHQEKVAFLRSTNSRLDALLKSHISRLLPQVGMFGDCCKRLEHSCTTNYTVFGAGTLCIISGLASWLFATRQSHYSFSQDLMIGFGVLSGLSFLLTANGLKEYVLNGRTFSNERDDFDPLCCGV